MDLSAFFFLNLLCTVSLYPNRSILSIRSDDLSFCICLEKEPRQALILPLTKNGRNGGIRSIAPVLSGENQFSTTSVRGGIVST